MKKRVSTLLLCVVTLCSALFHMPLSASAQNNPSDFADSSMYCWDDVFLSSTCIDRVIDRLHSLQVTDLYVEFSDLNASRDAIAKLSQNGISTYYLTGSSSWYKSLNALQAEIDQVASYNVQNPDNLIAGIVFDVEPYSDAVYKADPFTGFSTYVTNMVSAYQYANTHNISFVTVIPYWYDKYLTTSSFTNEQHQIAETLLRSLIQHSDRISVMNYYKNHMAEHISTEVSYASQYGVEIESIAEFGKLSETMGVEESVTFYVEDNPVEAAHAEWETVRTANPYENLHFSYHYLSIIAELYQDITKYQFTFLDADSGETYTEHYRIILPNGEITRKRTSSSVKIGVNTPFTLELENGEIVSLVSETCPDATTIQRTYLIHAKDTYTLEVYPKLWNGKKYSSAKTGTIRLVNTSTGAYQDTTIVGDSNTGYYTNVTVTSDTEYEMYLLGADGTVLNSTVDSIKYKDAAKVEHPVNCINGIISLPKGLKAYTCVTVNMQ